MTPRNDPGFLTTRFGDSEKEVLMPAYDLRCEDCKKLFEVRRSFSQSVPRKVKCPGCGSKNTKRIWGNVFAVTSKKS